MSLRTLWTGNLKIGLLAIPCKLYSATRESKDAAGFKLLHNACLQPISQQRCCETCNVAPVLWEDVVKGKEVSKDQYVAFTSEELAALEEAKEKEEKGSKSSKEKKALPTIESMQSMPVWTVPLEYADTSYWVSPEPAGTKAFLALLMGMSLSETDLLAMVTMRTRSRLCVVHAGDGPAVLTLTTLRFSGEIVDPVEVDPVVSRGAKLPGTMGHEVRLMRKLLREIEGKAGDWRMRTGEDEYGKLLSAAVERKAQERDAVPFEELLKQSIAEAQEENRDD